MRDFTIDTYQKLLAALSKSGVSFLTLRDFILRKDAAYGRIVMLRQDVDARPGNSLVFARIQHAAGIKATYYFRSVPGSFNEKIIREIASLGHEIGYHYETMDTCNGDVDAAYEEFKTQLDRFRKIVPIDTICMHGSPLSKYDNRDIWNKYDYKSLGIIAEPYFDLNFNDTFYLTDTGRRWDGSGVSIRDKAARFNDCTNPDFLKRRYRSTFDMIDDILRPGFPSQVMMNFHPQRWTDQHLAWLEELVIQNAKNLVKAMLVKKSEKRRPRFV